MPGYDHLQLGIDVTGADKSTAVINRLNEAVRTGAELTVQAGRKTVDSFRDVERAMGGATRASVEFAAQHPLLIAGMVKSGYFVVEHAKQVDHLVDAYRALRIAMSPTAFTAGTIGVGIALEAMVRNAEKYARINREISIEAARSGLSFQDILGKRTAARIEGGDFAEVFSGKSLSTIRELVTNYNKLTDPVDKAAFAVENFGAKAEKAMPMLRTSMLDSLDSAEKFAAGMDKLDRESLERFSNRIHALPDALHRIAAGFRDIMNTGFMRWMALAVAHTADTIGTAPTVNQIQGIDAPYQMPSFSSVAGAKAQAEAINRALLMMQAVDSGTYSQSESAIAAYGASREGIQGRLESAEGRRLRYMGQLRPGAGSALGTDLEQTVRTSLLQVDKEIAGYRASIKAIEDREKAIKDLATAQKELNAAMAAFNAFDTLGGKPQTRTEQLKTLLDPFGVYGSAYGLGDKLKAQAAASGAMEEFNLFEMGGAAKAESSADRTRRLVDPFGTFGRFAGLKGSLDRSAADGEAAIRSLRMEADFAARIVELRAGPGGELDAARQTALIRQKAIEDEYAKTGDLRAKEEESRRNEMEFQLRVMELQRRRIEEFRGEMGGLFDAILGGKSGLQQFALGEVKNVGRAVFSNAMTSWRTGEPITRQSLFAGGGVLGDMLGGQQGGALKISTDANTAATIANTQALTRIALSPSGGGGGFSPVSASMIARMVGSGGYYGQEGSGEGGWEGTSMPSGTNGDWAGESANPAGFSFGRGVGIGAAGLGAGTGIYAGIRSGGAAGAIGATGSALAGAGAIMALASKSLSWAGPAGAIAGMVLGSILPSLIPDPKQKRREELESERQARAFNMPTGYDYSVDTLGRSYDYDFQGRMRPIVVNINAIDAQSFETWGKSNPGAISAVVSHAAMNDETIPATLNQVMA